MNRTRAVILAFAEKHPYQFCQLCGKEDCQRKSNPIKRDKEYCPTIERILNQK